MEQGAERKRRGCKLVENRHVFASRGGRWFHRQDPNSSVTENEKGTLYITQTKSFCPTNGTTKTERGHRMEQSVCTSHVRIVTRIYKASCSSTVTRHTIHTDSGQGLKQTGGGGRSMANKMCGGSGTQEEPIGRLSEQWALQALRVPGSGTVNKPGSQLVSASISWELSYRDREVTSNLKPSIRL